MFELNPNLQQYFGYFKPSHPISDNTELVFRAVRLFNKAISRGRFTRMQRLITCTPDQLLDLNELSKLNTRAQHYGGLHAVLIEKIRGSLGRIGDFDCNFNRSRAVCASAGRTLPWPTRITPA